MATKVFSDARNAKITAFGAIIDPFTAVHAYSSILPPMELKLPRWTWQTAMDKMTAFFHAGPVTLPAQQVPAFVQGDILTSANSTQPPDRVVPLNSLAAGDWSWFQPYPGTAEDPTVPLFNAYGIDQRGDLQKPGFQTGPYTAIEGFLQLRNPLTTAVNTNGRSSQTGSAPTSPPPA
ncbi:hypothetical protein FGRMN_10597 [Fusarium graminum]|nr:hypothetical protein FGRMN_10597 [Fusarium graminum]